MILFEYEDVFVVDIIYHHTKRHTRVHRSSSHGALLFVLAARVFGLIAVVVNYN